MTNNVLITIFLIIFSRSVSAQSPAAYTQLVKYQDTLKTLSYKVINNDIEAERYNASYTMIKTLIRALKVPASFSFGFDSLKTVSVQMSPDRKFRIFSWHVMNDDGSYRYYGTIQMNNGQGALKMFPLIDHSPAIKKPQDTVITNQSWYGCQYYKIIPVTQNVRVPYYVLLGWKGNTVKSTKKIIEILYFKDSKAFFGMPVFDGNKDYAGKQRIVFEYSRQASMLLNYIPKEYMIVFDHLASPDPKLKDKPELYGPDLSYDGFKLLNGRWKYMPDLPLKNDPAAADDAFQDPRKPARPGANKF